MHVVVQFFHPALEKSRVNRQLAEAAASVSGVTFRDHYELYPDFDIDVDAEQDVLLDHDLVVFQHPLYWYSVPPLLKQWQDLVLEHGWAYGRTGTALRSKFTLHALTSGGSAAAYSPGGLNRRPLRDYLLPLEQTTRLCGMTWLAPFCTSGTHRMSDEEVQTHAASYERLLSALRDGLLDLSALEQAELANPLIPPAEAWARDRATAPPAEVK